MMNEITLGKLFELYVNIFDKFGIYLLNETDEMLDYYVFEATDINIGYCSRRILMRFLEEGLIDENIFENSLLFIKKFRKLEDMHKLNLKKHEIFKAQIEKLQLGHEILEKSIKKAYA